MCMLSAGAWERGCAGRRKQIMFFTSMPSILMHTC